MRARLGCSIGIAATLVARLAAAGTPFGGDDTGFVPPDKAASACEDGVARETARLADRLIRCNVRDSDRHVANVPFDGVACQGKARAKYDAKVSALTCAGATACVDRAGIRDLMTLWMNIFIGGVIFCDNTSGTPQDPPDTGFVPATTTIQIHGDRTARYVGRLIGDITKCHVRAADRRLQGVPYGEEACEAKAKGTFDQKTSKLVGRPACFNAPGLRDIFESVLDSNNGITYCASPSGAFLD